MKIFLVRHGQSAANVDKTLHVKLADHSIPLTQQGKEQAARAGTFLRQYIADNISKRSIIHDMTTLATTSEKIDIEDPKNQYYLPKMRLWTSPYRRTRETTEQVEGAINLPGKCKLIQDVKEHINLCEQRFGLFDGIPDDQLKEIFPREYEHYEKTLQEQGKFWCTMPLGESRFDVAIRVQQSFGTFHRDAQRDGIHNIIVVTHGSAMRAFIMQWCHYTPEWFDTERNPKNCAIRLIDGCDDMGFIYEGE